MTVYSVSPVDGTFITKDKRYEVLEDNGSSFRITADNEVESFCLWEGCGHIGLNNWKRIDESDSMTPCEKLGYKVGDEFEFIGNIHFHFKKGDVARLQYDDGSDCPPFFYKDGSEYCCVMLHKVVPLRKAITLRPGDYVSTKGMSEDDYHAVAEAFMNAGCPKGKKTGIFIGNTRYHLAGWSNRSGKFDEWSAGVLYKHGSRQLTIAQVLGTTKKEENPVTAFDTLIAAARNRNEARGALQEAESEFQSALDAANAELGEGFEIRERDADYTLGPIKHPMCRCAMTPLSEDMSDPSNWREGDVVELIEESKYMTVGNLYAINSVDGEVVDPEGDVFINADDDGDKYYAKAHKLRFHHRPA